MENDIVVFDGVSYVYGEKTPNEKLALDEVYINIQKVVRL